MPSSSVAARSKKGLSKTAEAGSVTSNVARAEELEADTSGDHPALLGGRVYQLNNLVEKPTAEFAREHLVTPGLGQEDGGEGRHLVVFGQYILPARRTFDILAEDIRLDRRER